MMPSTHERVLRRGLIAIGAAAAILGGALGAGLASSTAPMLEAPEGTSETEETVVPAPADDAVRPEPTCSYRPQIHLMVAAAGPGLPRLGGRTDSRLSRTPVCGEAGVEVAI